MPKKGNTEKFARLRHFKQAICLPIVALTVSYMTTFDKSLPTIHVTCHYLINQFGSEFIIINFEESLQRGQN